MTVDDTWASAALRCRHVAAGVPYVGIMLLERGEKIECELVRRMLIVRLCADCERWLHDAMRSEPIGGVEPGR